MANFMRVGFGQVEPNKMIGGLVEGRIFAQLPVDLESMGKVIENGRFAKYDYAAGQVNLTGPGEWMMIYNEEKLYDERKQHHKDFAMIAKNYTGGSGKFIGKPSDEGAIGYFVQGANKYDNGEIVPRLFGLEKGEIFTTNTIGKANTDSDAVLDTGVEIGDDVTSLFINEDGYLDVEANKASDSPEFVIVKRYTLADMQPAFKLMMI